MTIALFAAVLAVAAQPAVPPSVPPAPPAAAAVQDVDPAAMAAATKLLTTLKMDRMIERMTGGLIPMATTAMLGMLEHNPDTQAAMAQIESKPEGRSRLLAIFSEEMLKSFRSRYSDVVAAGAREYARRFTAAELNQLVAFFSAGTGAKWVATSEQLQQVIGAAGAEIGREAGREAGARAMQRAVQELLPSEKTSS